MRISIGPFSFELFGKKNKENTSVIEDDINVLIENIENVGSQVGAFDHLDYDSSLIIQSIANNLKGKEINKKSLVSAYVDGFEKNNIKFKKKAELFADCYIETYINEDF